ncbi:DsbA family protein [Crystallibacter degradans]|uniref:DsbA family protein n=1 Tax=Crystallibacter degradans TaxID=2726743 RepID=UPI003211EBBA
MTAKSSISLPNKIAIGIIIATVVVVIGIVALINTKDTATQAAPTEAAEVVRADSHRLSAAEDEKAVLVEFLDFECESCLAAYPFIEDLSNKYEGELTIVSRYFPLAGHPNSMNAALAVEAAAQQGKFEDMYHRMFETQKEWSHSAESRAATFRGYAEDLGLDLAAYDDAVADPATAARIEQDKQDGTTLGVSGTPTFFLDGKLIEPSSLEEFEQLVKDAIAK